MTKYTCTVDGSNNEAGITITVTDGTEISEFTVSDATRLNTLIAELEKFDNKYVSYTQLIDVLLNNNSEIRINATTLNNMASDKYAKAEDLKKYSTVPTDHSSTTTSYGVGDKSEYGHLKITDDLNTTASDTALSATGAKKLNDTVASLSSNAQKNSLRIFLGRNRTDNGEQGTTLNIHKGEIIYAHVVCDIPNYDYTKLSVVFYINGRAYTRKVGNDGKTLNADGTAFGGLTINLDNADGYFMTAFVRGNDQLNTASDNKLINVGNY